MSEQGWGVIDWSTGNLPMVTPLRKITPPTLPQHQPPVTASSSLAVGETSWALPSPGHDGMWKGPMVVRVLYWSLPLLAELRVYRQCFEKYCFERQHSALTSLIYYTEMSGLGVWVGGWGISSVLKCCWASLKTWVWALGTARCEPGVAECHGIHLWS